MGIASLQCFGVIRSKATLGCHSLINASAEVRFPPWLYLYLDFVLHTNSDGAKPASGYRQWSWMTSLKANDHELVLQWFRLLLLRVRKSEDTMMTSHYARPRRITTYHNLLGTLCQLPDLPCQVPSSRAVLAVVPSCIPMRQRHRCDHDLKLSFWFPPSQAAVPVSCGKAEKWRPSLVGWRPSLLGWRPSLAVCGGQRFQVEFHR